ncbi:sporulation protein, partial [filamentous cyanobacterium CCP4]
MTLLRQFSVCGLPTNRTLAWLKSGLKHGLGLSVLWWLLALPALAVEMRVAVGDRLSQAVVGSSTPAIIKNGAGQGVGQIPQGRSITIT